MMMPSESQQCGCKCQRLMLHAAKVISRAVVEASLSTLGGRVAVLVIGSDRDVDVDTSTGV